MEIRDLYNKNKEIVDIYSSDERIPNGYYQLVVMVFIKNNNNKFLVQKRTLKKNGLYGTTGGHPKSGESSIEGMISEIREEIGIVVNDKELKYVDTLKSGDTFVDIYYMEANKDINDYKLQTDEVDDIEYMDIDEINKLYLNNLFMKSHFIAWQKVLKFLEKN